MRVQVVGPGGVEERAVAELASLLTQVQADDAAPDTFVWVDVPVPDDASATVLRDVFGCHELAIRDAQQRNRVPRVHVYPEHVFVILHAPELGTAGHVHYIELDQFIAHRYLITVHGPVNAKVPDHVARREVDAVVERMAAGRVLPKTPYDLAYAITSTIARQQEAFIEQLTAEVWRLEQDVTGGRRKDTEEFLEELFQVRHGLVAVQTMAGLGAEIYGRILALGRSGNQRLDADIVDQFDRIGHLAGGERRYLQGVIEFYRTRTETKRTIAAERLTVIAVVTLPITALSSVIGMDVIVNDHTRWGLLVALLVVMVVGSGVLLTWAKRQGWW
jgi:Mg2+ and Co2+ transporter CorA